MKRIALFLFLILSSVACFAQTQIDPTYQIQWNKLSGSGAPSISCTQNGNYTVYPYGAEWGQPYQDTTNNVEYKCTTSGWVKNLPTTGGTLTGPISGTSATFSGTVAAAITNNICNASNQGTTNAGTDIAACEAIISNGGTIDARGYTSASTINGLRISKPLTLMLGPGPFNVTGIIDAHDTQNVTIECSYTTMTGNTGAGNPVIDAMGVNDFKMSGCIIAQGQGATKSTVGLLQARTAAWQHVERTHLKDDLIVLQSDPTANGGCGTFALYNYGAEVTEYDHLYLTADRPFVLTGTNAWPSYAPAPVHTSCGVTAPDVPFFTGNTTASSVTLGGQTNLISTYEAMILDGTFSFVANIGEASGSIIPGNNAIQMTQNNPNANISGEIEGYYRVINNVGQIEGSQFNMLCSLCQSSPFTGSLTTSAGSAIATPSTMVGLYPGQMITSANVPRGTLVNAVGTTTITMSTGTGVLAGTASATMGEPIITMKGSVQNSHFNIFDTGGIEANYIWSPNPAIVPSIGWSANLPANVDITWPTSSQSTAPIAGHWEIPYESGAATPIVSSNVQGSYCNPTGCSIVGDGILSGRSVSSTGQASSGSTVGKGGDYYMVGQSSWSQPSHLTTQDLANTGIAGTQLTRGGAAGTIALVLPDSGHGAQIAGNQAEWEGNYNPSYTYGDYGSVVAGSNGNYFTNTLAGDWVFYSATHRLVIGSGTGAGNIFTSSGVSIANALWLPSQETLSGYNCLQIDSAGAITKTGTDCGNLNTSLLAYLGNNQTFTGTNTFGVINQVAPVLGPGVVHFGDSVTAGTDYPASCPGIDPTRGAPQCSYAGQLDVDMGAPNSNYAQGGDQSEDMALKVYANYAPKTGGNPAVTVLIGHNDLHWCGDNTGCNGNFAMSLMASLSWLGITPGSNKVMANSATISGCTAYSAIISGGEKCSSPGNTISYSITTTVANQAIYVAWMGQDSNAGAATLKIDGTQVDALTTASAYGQTIATVNGRTTTVWARRYVVANAGSHTVLLTVTSASGDFDPIWAGTPVQAPLYQYAGAKVFVADPIYEQNYNYQSRTDNYTAAISSMVTQLADDGMLVVHIPTHPFMNVPYDMSGTAITAPDGIACLAISDSGQHPNNCGHWHLRQAFEAVMQPAKATQVSLIKSSVDNADGSWSSFNGSPTPGAILPGWNIYGGSATPGYATGSAVASFGQNLYYTFYEPSNFVGWKFCTYPVQTALTSTSQLSCTSPLIGQSGTTGSIGGSALTAGQCATGTASGFTGLTYGMGASAIPASATNPGDAFYIKVELTNSTTATVKVCAVVAGTPNATTYAVRVIQ